jgi:hypothetical protein
MEILHKYHTTFLFIAFALAFDGFKVTWLVVTSPAASPLHSFWLALFKLFQFDVRKLKARLEENEIECLATS